MIRSSLALVTLMVAACAPTQPASTGAPTSAATAAATGAAATAPAATSGPVAWRRVANITTPRSEVAAASFRGVVYVVGGFGGGDVVETYSGDRWSAGARYPLAVDHSMAAGIDAGPAPGLYVLGGNVNGNATARSFRFTGDQGWREIAPMPGPRAQGAAAAVDGKIYVVGGAAAGRLISPTYVYDPGVDRWSEAAAIPTPRDHLAAVSHGERVCAVGGRRLSMLQNVATLECYTPGNNTWRALPDAPTARGGLGAAALGDRLVVVGGEQPLGTFKEVEVFDLIANRWSRLPDLPTPRHGLGVVALGNTVYVMTGGPTPGGSQTAVCEALDLR